jgi:predicted Fe-Mo cluster-binding NifX family protein
MKVAVSAQGGDIEALVDPRFGRAAWFVVADTESGEWTAVDNRENVEARGGAGVQAGTRVADQGVAVVITGNVGPNAQKVLDAAGVRIHQAGNGVTVKDALARLAAGELAAVDSPTVAGHWS